MKKIFIASLIAFSCSAAFAATPNAPIDASTIVPTEAPVATVVVPTVEESIAAMAKVHEIAVAAEIDSEYCTVDIKANNPISQSCENFVKSLADMGTQFQIADYHKSESYPSLSFADGWELISLVSSYEFLSNDLRDLVPEMFVKYNPYPTADIADIK